MSGPPVAICIGLGGTHVLFWNPFAGGWFCDRVDPDDCMLDRPTDSCPAPGTTTQPGSREL